MAGASGATEVKQEQYLPSPLAAARVERGRKHDALLHGHVLPFVVDHLLALRE
jgi:hypothetical protein